MPLTAVGPVGVSLGLPGGIYAALNITAAAVIKGGTGIICRIAINVVGSAGNLTLNDCATTGAAAAANQIVSVAFGSLTQGQVLTLEWPCGTGIVVSSIPTGGQVAIAYS